MITVNHVVKTFDGFRALDGLDLTVPDGAVYGLVGPNGAGKTTVLRHLTGVIRQDSGEVLIDGAPVFENTAIKLRMASIPDEIYYHPQATIRDMMRFFRSIYPTFDDQLYRTLGRSVCSGRPPADAPSFQGYAEAGGILAGPLHPAGLSHAGRARWTAWIRSCAARCGG